MTDTMPMDPEEAEKVLAEIAEKKKDKPEKNLVQTWEDFFGGRRRHTDRIDQALESLERKLETVDLKRREIMGIY